jgi:DNA polymerase I-like protein with 3'-5' exonuclease and polymerase domains
MGKLKLQAELGLDRMGAKKLFDEYHAKVPFVRQLSQDLIEFASDNRLLFTLHDRFCRFDKFETTDKHWNNETNRFDQVPLYTEEKAKQAYQAEVTEKYKDDKIPADYMKHFDRHYVPAFTYKALNRLIQGGAADMTKKAMVDLYEKGILPQIQIHDELCLSIKDDKQAIEVKKTMESAIVLQVKNKVNYKKGLNWGNMKLWLT